MVEVVKQSHKSAPRPRWSLRLIWVSQYEWATRSPWSRYSFCPLSCGEQRRAHRFRGRVEVFARTSAARGRSGCPACTLAVVGLRLCRVHWSVEGLVGGCGGSDAGPKRNRLDRGDSDANHASSIQTSQFRNGGPCRGTSRGTSQ